MKELISQIAMALVDDPYGVVVSEIAGQQTMVLELKVSKPDVGKIIGRKGRTAQAIRTILGAASSKKQIRTVLEIVE